ncbi:unnamed protein product [Adineta ricciae]|uniref:F-box domain-containing protein n=1 Tax=Adineta ricciae TaxID=249248 RepID=A0A815KA28_ADIRI|nr:unnamed protein product [Adineta ricciae]CAF1392930.1 unnamed protein product [Adineta ricciae]
MVCALNKFPCELLHCIFDYFHPADLFYSFNEINPEIDEILHSYQRIRLNFKSTRKSEFLFICENVLAEQIQFLFLSNQYETPNQIQSFLALVPLIKCVHLRHLTLSHLDDPKLFGLILSYLEEHSQLRFLAIKNCSFGLNQRIGRQIVDVLITLSSLKHLTLFDSRGLKNLCQSLMKLTHLTIESCDTTDLSRILRFVPNLTHFNVCFSSGQMSIIDYFPSRLKSLQIKSKLWILFEDLENVLPLVPSLQSFLLETNGDHSLLNGQRWETLIKEKLQNLKEFHIDISVDENTMSGDEVLNLFQNSFWINEKHCEMGCLISSSSQSCVRIFSLPSFSPRHHWFPSLNLGFYEYSLSSFPFDQHYKELNIFDCSQHNSISSCFPQIETLILQGSTPQIDALQSIMNLFSVKHLKIESIDDLSSAAFDEILYSAPNLNELTLKSSTSLKLNGCRLSENVIYEQIKCLTITNIVDRNDLDEISRIFPKVERITLCGKERDEILPILTQLQCLVSATIQWSHPMKTPKEIIDKYLQQNHICSDGTYYFQWNQLYVWMD